MCVFDVDTIHDYGWTIYIYIFEKVSGSFVDVLIKNRKKTQNTKKMNEKKTHTHNMLQTERPHYGAHRFVFLFLSMCLHFRFEMNIMRAI